MRETADGKAVELETGADPRRCVIWLHGLGADGNDFVPIVPELGLPSSVPVRFVFPHAPMRPVTLNGGQVMRAWFDMRAGRQGIENDVADIRESADIVTQWIRRQEQDGIPAERVVLAGFSQGGVMALHTGLRYPRRLAGIMALSTYLALPGSLERELSPANRSTPVFMVHGDVDPLIPGALARRSCERLRELGLPVEWHSYPMAHSVCPAEITDIGRWLRRTLEI